MSTFEKIKPYIAPRYWFSLLGAMLILMGLTGGSVLWGVDLTIEENGFRYTAVALGVLCLVGGLRLYRMFTLNPGKQKVGDKNQ